MNHLCFVCFAELSPASESCFNCGSVRGMAVQKTDRQLQVQGITIAGETKENVVLKPEALPPGITFSNRFTIQEELAHTALWFRYLAVDLERGMDVELRTLREGDTESQGWQAMRYMQRYQGHPNLLGFMHVELESKPPFAVSDIQKGIQLSQFLRGRGGRIPLAESVVLIQDLLIGLAALHEEGYAHADVHPDSIWLDAHGRPRLDGGGPFGRSTVSIYAPPEQMEGGELTPQSDIYAMGLMWYRLLTGELPFASLEAADVQAFPHQAQKDLAPLSARLAPVVRRMLSANPQSRPADAQALLRELQVLFRRGWFNLPELVRSELGQRAAANRLELQGSVIAANDALRLLSSGSAIGTAALVGGKVVLQTSSVALTEAGLQSLLPDHLKVQHPVVQAMMDIMVHDKPNAQDLLKRTAVKTVAAQAELAQLAWMLNQPQIARARLGAAIQAAKWAEDWCAIAGVLAYFEDAKASKEALQQALSKVKNLDDVLRVASAVRWLHNDHGTTKRVLSRGANLVNGTQDALRFAAAWIALLLDTPAANVVLSTVLELSVRESVLVQCDHLQEAVSIFGLEEIWLQWLQRVQQQAKTPKEWERIAWLWQHLQQAQFAEEAHREGMKRLDQWRQKIESDNREWGIALDLPDLNIAAVEAFEAASFRMREAIQAERDKVQAEAEADAVKTDLLSVQEASSLSGAAEELENEGALAQHLSEEKDPEAETVRGDGEADEDMAIDASENKGNDQLKEPQHEGTVDDEAIASNAPLSTLETGANVEHQNAPLPGMLLLRILLGLMLCVLAFWLLR